MSVILVVSFLIGILATSWSLAMMWRLRNRRILFLISMLMLMTMRPFWTLFVGFSSGSPLMLGLRADLDEWLGLAVSLMAFVVVWNLEGVLTRGFGVLQTQSADRKRAEERLRLTSFSVDSCSTSTFWIRRDASFFYVNDAAVHHFGYRREELLSMTVHDIDQAYPPEVWPEYWENLQRQRSLTFETQLRCKDGRLIHVEITTNVLEFEDEEFVFAFVVDITERQHAEEALRRSESIQRSIMESSLDSIMLLDTHENILFINRTAPGLTPDQVINTPICQYVAEEFHPRMRDCFGRVLQTGQPDGYQVEYVLPNGTITLWEAKVAPVWADDQVTGLTVIARDETKRLRAEKALRESEEKFRVLTEKSPAAMAIAQLDRIVYGNPMLSTVSGYSNEELLEMRLGDIVHPEHRELLAERNRRRLKGEEVPQRYEIKIVSKSGDDRWLDLSAQLIDFDGAPAVLVTCVDVTERKLAEEQLRQKESQLAHVSRLSTMGEMVAGIAHEINQPLSAIANFAQASKNIIDETDYEFDAPVERWLQELNEQAVRCGDIIRRLRSFVQKGDDDREWTDLNRVIRESTALIESDLRHRSIVIDCHLPDPGMRVHVNQIQLQQVIVNLLRNACDATAQTATPKISIYVERHDDCARLTIEDNGRGVELSHRQKLFDTFFTTKPDGMGMGLAICKSIVEGQGGLIRFDSGTTQGATFHIELPIDEATGKGHSAC